MADVYPRIRITAAPTLDADVIADLMDISDTNLSSVEVLADDFTLGALDLEGDPDAIGVEWALRRISLTQRVSGLKPAALLRMQTLARAFLRQRFWLMFQLAASTTPVWFHAYLTPPGEVSWETVYTDGAGPDDKWLIKGGVDVDPFSYSARVTHPAKTVGNNPAGTNPAFGYALPTVRGDAPTRLRVKITPATTAKNAQRWLVACISSDRPNPVIDVPLGSGDGFVSGTTASSASSTNGSHRVVASSAVPTRSFSGLFPSTAAPPGQYQVWVRAGCDTNGTLGIDLRTPAGNQLTTTVVTRFFANSVNTMQYYWIPLGVIGINDSLPDDVTSAMSRRSMGVWTTNNAADMRLDHMLFVPVSGKGVSLVTSLIVESSGSATAVGPHSQLPLVLDGDSEVDWLDGSTDADYALANAGGFPEVDPGAATAWLLVMPLRASLTSSQSESTPSTAIGQTASVVTSYHPRSAALGDGL